MITGEWDMAGSGFDFVLIDHIVGVNIKSMNVRSFWVWETKREVE